MWETFYAEKEQLIKTNEVYHLSCEPLLGKLQFVKMYKRIWLWHVLLFLYRFAVFIFKYLIVFYLFAAHFCIWFVFLFFLFCFVLGKLHWCCKVGKILVKMVKMFHIESLFILSECLMLHFLWIIKHVVVDQLHSIPSCCSRHQQLCSLRFYLFTHFQDSVSGIAIRNHYSKGEKERCNKISSKKRFEVVNVCDNLRYIEGPEGKHKAAVILRRFAREQDNTCML